MLLDVIIAMVVEFICFGEPYKLLFKCHGCKIVSKLETPRTKLVKVGNYQ